jgi:hypothetical protein|nr:hypothetical protein [Thiocapsa sp. KS1]
MSARHSFTVKDVCAALDGVSRSRVHGWVQLPPFSAIPSQERSARRFSRADLLTFAVLRTLEDRFGARGTQLARVSAGIHEYLSAPQSAGTDDWLFVPLADGPARAVLGRAIAEAGWVIDLARERERIDLYLGILPPQWELPLMSGVGQVNP